jgi:signal transduction histidine kinase
MKRPKANIASASPDHGRGRVGKHATAVSNMFSRMMDGHITSWPASMQLRYGFTPEQAVGQISHRLLRTNFPLPLADIEAVLLKQRSWHGGLIHHHADGRAIMVMSQWDLRRGNGRSENATVTEMHIDATGIELADLFAIMANELSQPLTAIANYVNGARRSLQRHAPHAAIARNAMELAAGQIERSATQMKLMRSLAEELRQAH